MSEENNIPKHWQLKKLSELIGKNGVFCDGDWIESKDQDVNGDVRLIQLADIRDGYYRDKSDRHLTLKRANELNCTFLDQGDILVARMPDPLGRCCLFPLKGKNKFVTVVDVAIIRADENICANKYLSYIINSPQIRNAINNLESGTTRKRISRKNLNTIEFPIPPLSEQQAIVSKIEELLSDLDNGKQQLQIAHQQLKTYRQSLLNTIVTGVNCKSIESVIYKLDQGWSPKCLNEHSRSDNEWAVIKTTAIQHGNFNSIENKILPLNLNPREQHELKVGDILITRAGPRIRVGVCCMVKKTRPRLINCDKVYRIKVNTKIIRPEYFELILNTPYYQREIEKMKSGISDSGLNLTQSKFLKIEIPIPSLTEQQLIVDELESKLTVCDKIEETICQSLLQAESLRQSILKKAFEGKLI